MTLTLQPADPVLDLDPWVGQRQSGYAFELVNGVTGQHLGALNPARGTTAVLRHNTTQVIKRTFTVQLLPDDTAAINPLTDRILVSMLIADQVRPLGRYMWTNDARAVSTAGDTSASQLVDEMFIVDQPITTGFSPTGTVEAAVLDLLAGLPLVGVDIAASPYPAVGSWGPGTSRGQIINTLATQGDYQTPWIDNNGVFRMIRTVDPDTAVPAMDLDAGGRVLRAGILRVVDILAAPNRFVVVSNGFDAGPAPIVGTFDLPPTAPHSIANRGFVIPQVMSLQLASTAQAQAVARNLALRSTVIEQADLTTPPDPRHDSYDVLHWAAVNWLEVAWSLPLTAAGQMTHTLVRRFA